MSTISLICTYFAHTHGSTVQPPSSQSATEWPDGLNPFVPSIGDVKLEDNGLVMLYFSDGVRPPGWGTICGISSGLASEETVCRQLGYQGSQMTNVRYVSGHGVVDDMF